MSDTLDTAVPLSDASQNETDSFARIIADLDRAGRAWAAGRADAVLAKISAAPPGIMRAAGLDPPIADSLSPQWASEFRASSEKSFLLNFYNRIGAALMKIGVAGESNLASTRAIKNTFPSSDPAARHLRSSQDGTDGAGDETVSNMKQSDERVRFRMTVGDNVVINGMPFSLAEDAVFEGLERNLFEAGYVLKRKPYERYPIAVPRPR